MYPAEPLSLLKAVAEILLLESQQLSNHLTQKVVYGAKDYAWPLLRTMFVSVLSTEDWQVMMDHVIFNPPSWLYFFLCAFLL